ncbi:UNVERIFIED_CONTAM: hypothetical protein FKN15_036133 [Acipenser sinensis]
MFEPLEPAFPSVQGLKSTPKLSRVECFMLLTGTLHSAKHSQYNTRWTCDNVSKELFSTPTLTVLPGASVWEGEAVTLQCGAHINKQGTQLQYRYSKDNGTVRGAGSQDQHSIPAAGLRDTGRYQCEVEAAGTGLKKRSASVSLTVRESALSVKVYGAHQHTLILYLPPPASWQSAAAAAGFSVGFFVILLIVFTLLLLYHKIRARRGRCCLWSALPAMVQTEPQLYRERYRVQLYGKKNFTQLTFLKNNWTDYSWGQRSLTDYSWGRRSSTDYSWGRRTSTDYSWGRRSSTDYSWGRRSSTDYSWGRRSLTDYSWGWRSSTDDSWGWRSSSDYSWGRRSSTDYSWDRRSLTDYSWGWRSSTDYSWGRRSSTDYSWGRRTSTDYSWSRRSSTDYSWGRRSSTDYSWGRRTSTDYSWSRRSSTDYSWGRRSSTDYSWGGEPRLTTARARDAGLPGATLESTLCGTRGTSSV